MRRMTFIAVMSLVVLVAGCSSDGDDTSSEGEAAVVDSDQDSSDESSDDTSTDDDSASDGAAGDGSSTGEGALPEGFPEELTPPDDAVYDELLDSVSSGDQGGKKVFYVKAHIPGTVSEVADDIRSQLDSADYDIVRDEDTGVEGSLQSQGLDAENDSYIVYIMIDDLDTATSIDGSANVTYEVREQ